MAVYGTSTVNWAPVALSASIEEQSMRPYAHVFTNHLLTGDSTGGSATIRIDFKEANTTADYFLALIDIQIRNDAAMEWACTVQADQFDKRRWGSDFFYLTGGTTVGVAGRFAATPTDELMTRPVYIGSPRYSGTGRLQVHWNTNTNTHTYGANLHLLAFHEMPDPSLFMR